jgi:uncharacterized membrane protein
MEFHDKDILQNSHCIHQRGNPGWGKQTGLHLNLTLILINKWTQHTENCSDCLFQQIHLLLLVFLSHFPLLFIVFLKLENVVSILKTRMGVFYLSKRWSVFFFWFG